MRRFASTAAALLMLYGCSQSPALRGVTPAQFANERAGAFRPVSNALRVRHDRLGHGKVQHVVIIVQENRTTDNLFNGLPGADTAKYGLNTAGEAVTLQSAGLTAPWDLLHTHQDFNSDYDGGRMDGFNLESTRCQHARQACIKSYLRAYVYVPQSEVKPYFEMAEQYAFADKMFASQAGPSFPAHQYLLSGASTISQSASLRASENPIDPKQNSTGGCDSPSGSLVTLIDSNGTEEQQTYPCFDRPALTDLIDQKGLTWRWYEADAGAGLWNAPDAIKHIRYGSQFMTDVVSPPWQVLTDIQNGHLANVVWVTPTAKSSDHPGLTDGTGPSWVASIVNAVGESSYWNSTAIFVVWDDWGGLYDHVAPPQYNAFELGFRVPLIAIGPYAKLAYVSHRQHEFGSILKFTEKAFNLGSLGATDARADDLSDCFDFSQPPRQFVPIQAPLRRNYFLHQPTDNRPPDDD